MLNKYTWYAIQSKDKDGKMCAWAHRVRNNNNLISYHWGEDVISVNACDSKRDAIELAKHWNDLSRREGKYMFDNEPKF